jgi:hypothetical protein
MPAKKEIIYPFFLECCQHADDSFWEEIFQDLAYGKTPCGVYINKDFLCCSYKGKEFSYKIERKNSIELYKDIYTLLTERLGILSQREKNKKRFDFRRFEKDIKELRHEWTNIRRKYVKDVLYEKYVIEMKKKYCLSVKQCKYLLAVIIISIMFRTINTKDIYYQNDEIQHIDGIVFEEGKIILQRPVCSWSGKILETPQTDNFDGMRKMSDNWTKFLKMVR